MTDLYLKFADEAEAEPFLYDIVDATRTVAVPLDPPVEHQTWVYLIPANAFGEPEREWERDMPLSAADLAPGGDYETAVFLRNGTRLETTQLVEEAYLEKQPKYLNTDVLGTLYDVDNTDPENPIVTPLDGWYVNLRVGDYDPALDAFKVNPEPLIWRRMWA